MFCVSYRRARRQMLCTNNPVLLLGRLRALGEPLALALLLQPLAADPGGIGPWWMNSPTLEMSLSGAGALGGCCRSKPVWSRDWDRWGPPPCHWAAACRAWGWSPEMSCQAASLEPVLRAAWAVLARLCFPSPLCRPG